MGYFQDKFKEARLRALQKKAAYSDSKKKIFAAKLKARREEKINYDREKEKLKYKNKLGYARQKQANRIEASARAYKNRQETLLNVSKVLLKKGKKYSRNRVRAKNFLPKKKKSTRRTPKRNSFGEFTNPLPGY